MAQLSNHRLYNLNPPTCSWCHLHLVSDGIKKDERKPAILGSTSSQVTYGGVRDGCYGIRCTWRAAARFVTREGDRGQPPRKFTWASGEGGYRPSVRGAQPPILIRTRMILGLKTSTKSPKSDCVTVRNPCCRGHNHRINLRYNSAQGDSSEARARAE